MAEQLIYLEVDDGIAEAVARLRKATSQEVVMVAPPRATLLQNVVNLRVLKRQADLMGRSVSLVTRDEVGRNFATQAGFKVLDEPGAESVADTEVVEAPPEDVEPTPEVSTTSPKIKFSKYQPSRKVKPQLVAEDEESEDEAIEIKPLDSKTFERPTAMRSPNLTRFKLKLERHHQIFIGFIVIGLLVLGSVGFFILPKAHVSLEVQSEAFARQFTLLLADEQDRQAAGSNILTGRFVEVSREDVSTFDASGEENRGEKAQGTITIINRTGSIQGLVVNTRFQSESGLVFRLKNEILVPPASGSTPGQASVAAIADEGGTKYNVSAPTKLTIPGLGDTGIDLVYGEVSGTFTGGTDEITKAVSEEDIATAKEEASKNIFVAAEAELQDELQRGEGLVSEMIQNDIIDAVPSVSAGAKRDTFDIRVQSRSWTILVTQDELVQAIANAAAFEVPEGKQATQATLENAKIDVVESNFLNHQIKLLVTLDGRVGPQLDEDGIVAELSNKSVAEGVELLQDQPEITSASIEIWPTFINRIPLILNNIKLHIIYLGE